jgi:cytochrome c556
MRNSSLLAALSLLVAAPLTACHGDASADHHGDASADHHGDASADHHGEGDHAGSAKQGDSAHDEHGAHEAATERDAHAEHGAAAHDDLDLVTIMRGLEVNMQELEAGLWRDDLGAVAAGADAIAQHPHVGPTDRARIQTVLGAGFRDFVAADKVTHGAAVAVSTAAKAGDRQQVVSGLATLQASCVQCHDSQRPALRGGVEGAR